MRPTTSRILNIVCLALTLAPGACSSLRDQAVPGCPHCGDPVTLVGPGGRNEVVSRWRLAAWNAVPDSQPGTAPSIGERAVRGR